MARGEYGRIVGAGGRGEYRRVGWDPTSVLVPGMQPGMLSATPYHSVSDRDRAVEEINTGFKVFVADFLHAIGVNSAELDLVLDPKFPTDKIKQARYNVARAMLMASPYYSLWRDVISPVLDEWHKFYVDQSTWNEFLSSYGDYERWMSRLQSLRDAVSAQNIKLHSIPPTPLPRTIWQEAGGVAQEAAQTVVHTTADLGKILKYALIGAAAIAGAVAVSSIAVDVKKGRAPADRYAGLTKGLLRGAG